jgi:hypothetical protein
MDDCVCSVGEIMMAGEKPTYLKKKSVPLPLYLQQIPHGLAWDWTWALHDEKSATAWAMHGPPETCKSNEKT